ncbi:MAG: glycerophosphodiester phosphodiesterase [bacterium]
MTSSPPSRGVSVQLPPSASYKGRRILFKYHRLLSGRGRHPPNSISALQELISEGAEAIEFDIHALNGGDYLFVHDETLDRETTGSGSVAACTARDAKLLRLRGSSESPALLSEAVLLLRDVARSMKVQVDLKDQYPLSDEQARSVLRALEPLRANPRLRVVVGCLADWNLRTLRRLDSTLLVGLDFAFYLDAAVDEFPRLPTRENVHGYLDDHPLGFRRAMPVRDYLEDRITALCGLVREPAEIYLRKELIAQAMTDGCHLVQIVRRELGDIVVDGWTLNAGDRDADIHLKTLLEAGVDQITTDTAVQLETIISAHAR